MANLEKQLLEVIKTVGTTFSQDKELRRLEDANQEFKDLIQKGVIKERGNNLLSPSDRNENHQVQFNV